MNLDRILNKLIQFLLEQLSVTVVTTTLQTMSCQVTLEYSVSLVVKIAVGDNFR